MMEEWGWKIEVQKHMRNYFEKNRHTPYKVEAIKIVRENTGMSFIDAKEYVESGKYND